MPFGARDVLLTVRARDQASRVFHEIGRSMGTIGAQGRMTGMELVGVGTMLQGVGIGIAAIGASSLAFLGSSIKVAVAYRQEAALTLTQVDKIGVKVQDVEKIGLRTAKAIPAPYQQLQKSLFDIFSSMDVGMVGAERMLRHFARGAVAGQTDVQTAGRATIAIMNAFGFKTHEVGKVMDLQFQIVRKGVITYEEFARTIGRAIPSAVKAGQSMETLGAMITFMTRNGLSAAMAATSAARALDLLANPKFAERMKEFGINVHDAQGKIRPMIDITSELRDKLQRLPLEDRAKVLHELTKGAGGTIQAMRFFNLAINDTNGLLPKMEASMYRAAGAADIAYKIMSKTPQAQIDGLKNMWFLLRQEIGDNFLGAVGKISGFFVKIINWFMQLSPGMKDAIANFLAIGGAVMVAVGALTILFGLGLQVIGVWKTVIPVIANAAGSFIGLAGALGTAQGAWMIFQGVIKASVVGLAVVSIIGLLKALNDQAAKAGREGVSDAKRFVNALNELGLGPVESIRRLDAEIQRLDRAAREASRSPLELTKGLRDLGDVQREMGGPAGALIGWLQRMDPEYRKSADGAKHLREEKKKMRDEMSSEEKAIKETQKAYQEMEKELGKHAATTARLNGLTVEQTKEMQKEVKKHLGEIADAFKSATSVVAKFGEANKVTKEEVMQFFKDQLAAAKEWAAGLAELATKGLDEGLLKELRAAGPKTAPLVKALLDAVAAGNLEAINKARRDLDQVLTEVQDGVKKTAPFLETAGKIAGQGAGEGIKKGLDDKLPVIELGGGQAAMRGVWGWRGKDFEWRSGGKQSAEQAKKGIDDALPVIELGGQQASGRGSWGWRSKYNDWRAAGKEAAETAGAGIDAGAPTPEGAAGRVGAKGVEAVRSHKRNIHAAGQELTEQLAQGIEIHDVRVYNELREMVNSGAQVIKENRGKFNAAGSELMQGVANGINDNYDPIHRALVRLANRMRDDFRRQMQAWSPSRLFARLAESIPQGVALGIRENEGLVHDAANSMWSKLAKSGIPTMPIGYQPTGGMTAPAQPVGSTTTPAGRGDVHLHLQHVIQDPDELVHAVKFSHLTDGW